MQEISVLDAQTSLQQLINAAVEGETVLIIGDDQRVVQLIPVQAKRKPRKAGSANAKGKIIIADDFDAPLPEFEPYSP